MSRVRRDIEAMADLLLGPATGSAPDRVTVLIEGNLPSRGDGWRVGAASLVADKAHATFLQSRFGALDVLQVGGAPIEGDTLSALFEAAPAQHQWIVSAGSRFDAQTLAGVDEITLLTGVDEAAIVAAYGLLKRIVCEREGPMPVVSLVLAGADSLDAGDRFVHTARARLGVEPVVRGRLASADSTHHAWRRLPLSEGGIRAVLTTLVAAAGSRSGAAAAAGQHAAPVIDTAGAIDTPPVRASVPPAPTPAPTRDAPAPTQAVAQGQADARGQAAAASNVDAVSPHLPSRSTPPLPADLTPLGVNCPCAPSVVFATDEQGALHAVATSAQLADLVAALAWASQHAAMLPGAGALQGHVLVGDVHSAAVLAGGPWPVHVVVESPQGTLVLPASQPPLSAGPSRSTVPGWPTPTH